MAFAFASRTGLYTERVQIAYPTVRDEDPRPWLEIRRTLHWRRQRRKSRWLLELIGIALVLVMSIPTAWWVGSELSLDFSGLTATVESLAPRRTQPEQRIVGYTGQDNSLAGDPSQASVLNPQNPTGS